LAAQLSLLAHETISILAVITSKDFTLLNTSLVSLSHLSTLTLLKHAFQLDLNLIWGQICQLLARGFTGKFISGTFSAWLETQNFK